MLPIIPKVSQIIPGVIRILGMNPSPMTLQGTNSYLLGNSSSQKRLLIDTSNPDQKDYCENISQFLQKDDQNQLQISQIIITHWHPDHIGSVPNIINLASSLNHPIPKVYKFVSEKKTDIPLTILNDNQIFDLTEFGMGSLSVIHTPGHTDDHICLFLKPENILFSADLILGHGSTTFENLSKYMDSLQKIKKLQNEIAMILPGHGLEIKEPILKIEEYLSHRLERIKQVKNILDVSNWKSEMDIIKKVYIHIIHNPQLTLGALKNQHEALNYLLIKGEVECRPLTDSEKQKQENSLSSKMWKLK